MDRKLLRLGFAYFFISTEFWFPIWVIFLQFRGLTYEQVLIADMVYMGGIALMEFPLGSLGDRFGRRTTYIFGCLSMALAFLMMIVISNFYLLLLSWLLWAAGLSFISGTDSAYIYEMIRNRIGERAEVKLFGFFIAIKYSALLTSHFLAGFLYALHENLPIAINCVFSIIAACLIFTLPDTTKKEDKQPNFVHILKDTVSLLKNKQIQRICIIISFLYAFQYTIAILIQPLMVALGVQVKFFGYLYVAFTGLGILGGLAAGWLDKHLGMSKIVFIGIFLCIGSMAITAFIPGTPSLVGIVLQRFAYSLAETMLIVSLNRLILDKNRSSIFSLVSLFSSSLLFLSRPIMGLTLARLDKTVTFSIWLALGIPLAMILLMMYRRFISDEEQSGSNDEGIEAE